MTLRSAAFVTEPITGPRSRGVAAPQRIGKRAAAVPGSGCEVSRMWVWRFDVVIGHSQCGTEKAPRSRRRGSLFLQDFGIVRRGFGSVNAGTLPVGSQSDLLPCVESKLCIRTTTICDPAKVGLGAIDREKALWTMTFLITTEETAEQS